MKIAFFAAVSYASIISGRTKQLALALKEQGHEVWFVEMPGVRNFRFPPFRRKTLDGMHIVTLFPFPGSYRLMDSSAGRVWRACCGLFLKKSIRPMGSVHAIVSNPWWISLLRGLNFKSLTYDCIDHISVHCGEARVEKMKHWERMLLQDCQNIFIIRPRLVEELNLSEARQIRLIPNGVPDDWVRLPMKPGTRKSPCVGFVGSLYEWVDKELILYAARRLPDMDFVLIGPMRREVSLDSLRHVPNVEIRPPVPFSQVPEVISGFDVCIIPFKRDIISDCADPLKLYEYLALGKAVVSSMELDGDAPVYMADTPERFVECIQRAVAEEGVEALSEQRKLYASRYSWRIQAAKVSNALE